MCSLGTGKRSSWRELSRWGRFSQSDIDALVAKELHQLAPMGAALPVSPQDRPSSEQWRWWSGRGSGLAFWPENSAGAARFLGGGAIALALLLQGTGTTMPDAGGIDNAQAAITFRSPFLRIQGSTGGTA